MPRIRSLPLLCLALLATACSSIGGLDTDQRNELTNYLENAAAYYDRGQFNRAFQQWGKALEVDPDAIKGRLGQAMCLYQLGREPTREGMERLKRSEDLLEDLLDDDLEGQEWKAQLGYGLVQSQWVSLYDKKIRLTELELEREQEIDEESLAANRRELARRIAVAKVTFAQVLSSEEEQLVDRLTSLLELARLNAYSHDYETSLAYCRKYEVQVQRSKEFWKTNVERLPKEAPLYESKIKGVELQETELRDLMGNVLYKLKRFDDAERELDQVIALQPKRANAYLNRGIIRQSRGDWDRARADLEAFLEFTDLPRTDPAVQEAADRLDAVEELVEAEDEIRRRADGNR